MTSTAEKPQAARSTLGHITELDGLRGIAVGLVLLIHFWPNVGWWRAALPVTELGWIGVDLFFVLSGFLITGILLDSTERSDYYSRFYLRRACRIFPLYYAFLTLLFLFVTFWHGGAYLAQLKEKWGSPVWFFIYLANFITVQRGAFAPFAPLGPTWSLQIEEQFYICFPFLVRLLRRKLWVALVAIMFFALGWRILMYVTIPGNPMIQYAGTLSRADTLAAGGLAAFLMRHMRADRLRAVVGWLMPVSLGVLVTMYCVVGSSTNSPFTRTAGFSLNAVAFASLILWVVERRRQIQTAVFRLPPLQFLGKISYGVYVLQLPVQAALKLVTGTGLGSVYRTPGQCLLWLCATISVAWLSWKYFEKPVLDWGGKWKTRKIPSLRKAPAQPASS